MTASTLMIQGTASAVGKSTLVTALCRLFRQEGYRVLPFKSQNMALNAYVTPLGGEIGRAQAVQAEAAGAVPHVDMNPILLKPEGEARCQVVVLGEALGAMGAAEYHAYKPQLRDIIAGALARLRSQCDLVLIEGAGSPAEVNLRSRDIVNMHVAEAADAKVLLVGDIDRGGVFAAIVGTLELLEPHERSRVAGWIINKFRGDVGLLKSGLDFLEEKTGRPVFGVVPYLPKMGIADEDSLSLDDRPRRRRSRADELDIAIVRYPRISNHDEFLPLEDAPQCSVRFVDGPEELDVADLVILPGSKATLSDLEWMRREGMGAALQRRAEAGGPILGICGGCQMLGESIRDPEGVESLSGEAVGLGLLPLATEFQRGKRTAQVRTRALRRTFLGMADDEEGVEGYVIHSGRVSRKGGAAAPFRIRTWNGKNVEEDDGAMSPCGSVVGTMVHGLLENPQVLRGLVNALRSRKGWEPLDGPVGDCRRDEAYDRLALHVRQHLDMERLFGLVDLRRGLGGGTHG